MRKEGKEGRREGVTISLILHYSALRRTMSQCSAKRHTSTVTELVDCCAVEKIASWARAWEALMRCRACGWKMDVLVDRRRCGG